MDLYTLFKNASGSYSAILALMMDACLLIGFTSTMWGLNALRPNSWYRERGGNPVGGLWAIGIGSLLIFIPSAIESVTQTIFATSTANYEFAYASDASTSSPTLAPIIGFMQLFGTYAFIKGLMTLRAYGIHGERGNVSLKSGLVWIVSGCALINIYRLAGAMAATFGIGASALGQ